MCLINRFRKRLVSRIRCLGVGQLYRSDGTRCLLQPGACSTSLDTDSVELTVKTLLSRLVTGEFDSPTSFLRTPYGRTRAIYRETVSTVQKLIAFSAG
eukprot:3420053-Pyramimonas_sp.AAC.1